MTRSVRRIFPALLLAIALVVSSAALIGGASSASAAAAAAAPATSPSNACRSEYNTFVASAKRFNAKSKQVRSDKKRVQRKQAKVARAKSPQQKRQAKKQLRKAKKNQARHTRQQSQIKKRAVAQYGVWQSCETRNGNPTSPIQTLCDAGLPQAVCDAFNDLPIPVPGSTGDSPIQPLCDAGLPQALCDASIPDAPTGPLDPILDPLCALLPALPVCA